MKIQSIRVLCGLIGVIALTRLLPHPPNFSPVVALALFGGAAFAERRLAYLVPLAAMLLADLFIGFHQTMMFVYVGMALVVVIGRWLGENRRLPVLALTALAGSGVFFLLSNAGVWWLGATYPHSLEGLLACYVAALPFFHNTVLATVVFAALLFGFEYCWKRFEARQALAAA
ncbi:MAG TPA: hypothetical protein DCF62_06530 [Porticoccaceae bacterium]|nr:hypothetical protein [Porticoccaceae bacterium]HCO59671.1 hypothetical protein [Porticoccaceae bacterium]